MSIEVITITKIDELYFHVDASDGVLRELHDAFEFEIPKAKYHPKVRAGIWDGKIRMLDRYQRMYMGLYSLLKTYCENNDYDLVDAPNDNGEIVNAKEGVSPDEIIKYVESLDIHSNGEPLETRDYQLGAIYAGVNRYRATLLSATSSGKSYMIYCIIRWILDKVDSDARILLIVPTQALVNQMYSDFEDYSSQNGFDVESYTQIIMEGERKKVEKNIVISTWQSIYMMPAVYFNQFTGILCDEVHTAKADSIRGIMEKSTKVKYRIGFTGSLDKAPTHVYVVQGLFGKVYRVARTRDLIDAGHVSDINIQCITFKYTNKEEQKMVKEGDYTTERIFLINHPTRNKMLRSLAINCVGNTLVLFTNKEHGDELYRLIKQKSGDRKVFLVHGEAKTEAGKKITAKYTNEIRSIVEKEDDAIIIASYKMFSTGINIKRLFNVIAAAPTRSLITILQSIGRGLRKAKGKTHFNWFDISDLIWKTKKYHNITYGHFIDRLAIYTDEEFDYTVKEITI